MNSIHKNMSVNKGMVIQTTGCPHQKNKKQTKNDSKAVKDHMPLNASLFYMKIF